MTCYGCQRAISPRTEINNHHIVYRSQGGTETAEMHKRCHVRLHKERNDFAEWGRVGGRISSIDGHWAFYLKHVADNPAYDHIRADYIRQYSRSGLPPVLALDERDLKATAWGKPLEQLTLEDVKTHAQILKQFRRVIITIGDVTIRLKGTGRKLITSR